MPTPTIGCVTAVYKRTHTLTAQLRAIAAQSVKPSQIIIWNNSPVNITAVARQSLPPAMPLTVINAAPNMGVWPRFSAVLELNTEYACVFDDDTIPGSRWFENCLNCMKKQEGVYGTTGVLFNTGERKPNHKVGWTSPKDRTIEVDLVGHSWFFKKDWIRYYLLEPRMGCSTCGEDYHLSIALYKHLKIKTFVPPHPATNKTLWGSVRGTLGWDGRGLANMKSERVKRKIMHDKYRAGGWLPLCLRNKGPADAKVNV